MHVVTQSHSGSSETCYLDCNCNRHSKSRVYYHYALADAEVYWLKHHPRGSKPYFQFSIHFTHRISPLFLYSSTGCLVFWLYHISHTISSVHWEMSFWTILSFCGAYHLFVQKQCMPERHVHHFEDVAKRLSGHTLKCVISFWDLYRHPCKCSFPLQNPKSMNWQTDFRILPASITWRCPEEFRASRSILAASLRHNRSGRYGQRPGCGVPYATTDELVLI